MAQATMMDTQEELTKLVEAGADEKLAEAVEQLHARAQVTDPVTKTDFNDFREDLSARFDKVEADAGKISLVMLIIMFAIILWSTLAVVELLLLIFS